MDDRSQPCTLRAFSESPGDGALFSGSPYSPGSLLFSFFFLDTMGNASTGWTATGGPSETCTMACANMHSNMCYEAPMNAANSIEKMQVALWWAYGGSPPRGFFEGDATEFSPQILFDGKITYQTGGNSSCDAPSLRPDGSEGPRICCCADSEAEAATECPSVPCGVYGRNQDQCSQNPACNYLPAWRTERNAWIASLRKRAKKAKNKAARKRLKSRIRRVARVYAACKGNSGCQLKIQCANICRPLCVRLPHCKWETSDALGCQSIYTYTDAPTSGPSFLP